MITCEDCEDEFGVAPHLVEKRSFCSQECVSNSRVETEDFDCKACGVTIITTPSIARRRDYCSRQCSGSEFDKNLSDAGRQRLSESMQGDNNPMKDDSVSTKKVENTDYAEVGEKISDSRKEMIESGELEKVVEENGSVVCQICGDEFKSITNTHLESKHNCTVKEYKERFPNAKINGGKQVKIVENHKVTSIEISDNQDVYDLNVPETHNFFAGKNVGEGSTKTYTNVHNCGEQPLEEYEACNLGHINLSTIVDEDTPDWRAFEKTGDLEEDVSRFLEESVDWERLDGRIERGTHFLENVVTMSDFPVDEIVEKVSNNRKVGLGIMGLAQMYIQMGVKYGSETGDEVARQVMNHINHTSKEVSSRMATGADEYAERGSFNNWHKSKYADPESYPEWFEQMTGEDAEDWSSGFPIRNHNTTTIAPTGTTSMIGDTTGGCEPIYQVAFYKNVTQDVQGDEMLVEFDDYFLRTLEENDIDVEAVKKEAQRQTQENEFDGVYSLDAIPNEVGELFVTTGELDAEQHISVQCALQDGIDSAISKTVNAPSDATPEDTRRAFMEAYEQGGKGITYYRDGTRSKQVVTTRADNQATDEEEAVEQVRDQIEEGQIDVSEEINTSELGSVSPQTRPKSLTGTTKKLSTGYGDLFVTINEVDEGQPFEVFANIGKSGAYTESFTESTARLISLCLRCGIEPEDVIEQIEGIRSPKVSWDKGDQVYSVPDGIALAMRRYIDEKSENLRVKKQVLRRIQQVASPVER